MSDPTLVETASGTARFVCHMAQLSGAHPRNSLGAIRECFEAGAARIEIDIHSLAGPDYIVFHDRRLDEHTSGAGPLGKATPDEVRAVRFLDRPDDRPPLLSDVVAMARDVRTEIQLDLKDWRPLDDDRLRALADTVAPVRDRVVISTGQDWNLRRLHRADAELSFGFDPGHYLDHAIEGTPLFLPRTMGAYGYRDDHPIAFGRTESVTDYLRERWEMLVLQVPGAREYFISYRLVLQMLDDGFDVTAFLHERSARANVWTADYSGPGSIAMLDRLVAAGVDSITTNTIPAWAAAH